MSRFIFTNFAKSTLAGLLSTSATSLTVQAGDGALFPSPSSGQVAPLVLVNTATPNAPPYEIVYCTARSSDTMTVLRAQEGTSAQNWPAGSTVSHRLTAGAFLPGTPICDTKEFDSGSFNINNNAGYTILQTVNFTFPNNSLTGGFLLFVNSILTITNASPNTVTFTGSLSGGILTVSSNPSNYVFLPSQIITWNSGANSATILGFTGTANQYWVNTGSTVSSTSMTVTDQIDIGLVAVAVRDTTDAINLIYPAAEVVLAFSTGAGQEIFKSGFASNNPGSGTGDEVLTFAAGSTYTLKQKAQLATAAAPVTQIACSGKLILTAVANQ